MRSPAHSPLFVVFLLLGVAGLSGALIGCSSEDSSSNCEPACPAASVCQQGRCLCERDEQCAPDQFCNSTGTCQARPFCRSNADCGEGRLCDLSTGRCRTGASGPDDPEGACWGDTQCSLGEVCAGGQCTAGCRDDGDCGLGAKCRSVDATGFGTCVAGACDSNADCSFGSRCVGDACFESPNSSHCAPCGDRDCPFEGDFCLVDLRFDPAQDPAREAAFCAVACAGDPDICPSGYTCGDVRRLTNFRCRAGEGCGSGRACVVPEGADQGFCECASTADCPNDEASPQCVLGFCRQPPGRLCQRDDDCEPLPLCGPYGPGNRDVCVSTLEPCAAGRDCLCRNGTCQNSNRPCTASEDCFTTCVDGGCKVGEACRPIDGLRCSALR